MTESWLTWAMLLGAAFLGGGLNAVAGGGSFFTFPALVYAGVPPVAANATGTLSLLPGYMASTWGFREELRAPAGLSMLALVCTAGLGGALGAGLLVLTPDALFSVIVPWLLLAATLLFALGPRLLRRLAAGDGEAGGPVQALTLFAVSVYGGYFNGGLGIVLLAAFGLLGHRDLNAMQGLKNLVSAVLTAIAVCLYAVGGSIVWLQGLVMMFTAVIGGYVVARLARHLPEAVVRAVVIVTGAVMTVLFFLQ
ncbi:MAG: sulfite exporter TauE/SafE family protein [Gammaproteobacteria bacterium]|nr:sulfite exporter TauE/SafE family protein [Gammaproteobacteria bacterium]MDX5374821.1 sulfite exporter TauE/SafE family protein [Gammaproteobacteria bacterium]